LISCLKSDISESHERIGDNQEDSAMMLRSCSVSVVAIAAITAVPALGQATITSSHRSIGSRVFVQDHYLELYYDFTHSLESTELGQFDEHTTISTNGLHPDLMASSGDVMSSVGPNAIVLDANVDADYGWWFEGSSVSTNTTVQVEIEFSIAVSTPFELDLIFDGRPDNRFGDGGSATFLLKSASEVILETGNKYDKDSNSYIYDGEHHLAGMLAPGDYTLSALLLANLGVIPASEGTIEGAPGHLDFSLTFGEVPAPSAAMVIVMPLAGFGRRRRQG